MAQKSKCKLHRRRFAEVVGCYLRGYKKQRRILEEAYRALLDAGGGSGKVLLTKHAIRAMGGSQKEKQNNTRRKEKNSPPLQ